MASRTAAAISTSTKYDEILSTSTLVPSTNGTDSPPDLFYDFTNLLLILFPVYVCAILLNLLSIYTILTTKVYRQYLSHVLWAVVCIGALINAHGSMFLILSRWSSASDSDVLCSTSLYLRDSGSVLIHMHIFLLACERVLATLRKQPGNTNNNLIQKAHLFLIGLSFVSIILALTVPIYTLQHSEFASFHGFCVPNEIGFYRNYFNWIFYGFGHAYLWLAGLLLAVFFLRRTTVTYATLMPMNRLIFVMSAASCVNLLIGTLFEDTIGVGEDRPIDTDDPVKPKIHQQMNLRDFVSIVHKLLVGSAFYLFRPEIRQWLCETRKRFQGNQKEVIAPQMLDIRNEADDELDDGNLQFRTDS